MINRLIRSTMGPVRFQPNIQAHVQYTVSRKLLHRFCSGTCELITNVAKIRIILQLRVAVLDPGGGGGGGAVIGSSRRQISSSANHKVIVGKYKYISSHL